jgi:hypothetical protein
MKVHRIDFSNYKSLRKQSLLVDGFATVLMGPNDAGKTNILDGIQKFGSRSDFDDNDKCRHADPEDADPTIAFHFTSFSEEDRESLGRLPTVIAPKSELVISRTGNQPSGYLVSVDGRRVEIGEPPPRDEDQDDGDSPEDEPAAQSEPPPADAATAPSEAISQVADAAKSSEESPGADAAEDQTQPLPPANEKTKSTSTSSSKESFLDSLWAILPVVELFNNPPELPKSVTVKDLTGSSPQFQTARGLLKLAGLKSFSDLESAHDPIRAQDVRNRIQQKISALLSEHWRQDERIEVGLVHNKPDIVFSFMEPTGSSTYPELHSEATREYVAILVDILTRISSDQRAAMVLLDEPGISLHPGGQKDLLALLRSLSHKHQLIYTSHSPYLIDKNYPGQVRLVHRTKAGTEIVDKAHHTPAPYFTLAYEPLRVALGVGIGDTLVFDEQNVVVEGPADQIIICGLSQEVATAGLPDHLDLNRVSVVPAGSANNIETVARMAKARQLKVVALLDSDQAGREEYDRLAKRAEQTGDDSRLLVEELVSIAAVYPNIGASPRAIEDLLPRSAYFDAVNRFYGRTYPGTWAELKHTTDQFKKGDKPVAELLAEYFGNKKEYGSFDKVRVAREFIDMLREASIVKTDGTPKKAYEEAVRLVALLKARLEGSPMPAPPIEVVEPVGEASPAEAEEPEPPDDA